MAKAKVVGRVRMSNSAYHRGGKPSWWMRIGSGDSAKFVDIPQIRGDSTLEVTVDLPPGTASVTIGAGKGSDGVRATVVPIFLERASWLAFCNGRPGASAILAGVKVDGWKWRDADLDTPEASREVWQFTADEATADAACTTDEAVVRYGLATKFERAQDDSLAARLRRNREEVKRLESELALARAALDLTEQEVMSNAGASGLTIISATDVQG